MEPTFWANAWAEGRTNFHQEQVHPELIRLAERFLADGPHRILVPLCGKTVDLGWLRDRGHEVVGVELVPKAVAALFEREASTTNISPVGRFREWSGAGMTVLQGDVFDLDPALVGTFDRIWDRAAMVALTPTQRVRYVQTLRSVLRPGGIVLAETFLFDPDKKPGPPHAVFREELVAAWGNAEPIGGQDITQQMKDRGWPEVSVATWWIQG